MEPPSKSGLVFESTAATGTLTSTCEAVAPLHAHTLPRRIEGRRSWRRSHVCHGREQVCLGPHRIVLIR